MERLLINLSTVRSKKKNQLKYSKTSKATYLILLGSFPKHWLRKILGTSINYWQEEERDFWFLEG